MPIGVLITIVFLSLVALVEVFVVYKNKKIKQELIQKENELRYQVYETTILAKINDKIDYSLSVQNAIDVIIEFLPDLFDYSAVCYTLLFPERIDFKVHLKKIIGHNFLNDIKSKSLAHLSSIVNKDLSSVEVKQTIWGPEISEEAQEVAGSFFNIPLTISGNIVGVLTVSSNKVNLYGENEIKILNKISEQACGAVTQLQEVVQAENSKLNAMVYSMTDGVVMTDKDYKIMVVNPAAAKAVGLEYKSNLLLSDFVVSLGDKLNIKEKVESSIWLDESFVSDELLLKNGFFKILVLPVKNKDLNIGCVIVFRDINKEKEIERIKEDFTSMIVHELRSPLDTIKKMIEMMRATKMKKQSSQEVLQMIYGSSSDMLELVNNLLNIAKIEAGKFELRKEPSNIKETINSRVVFFEALAQDAKVSIKSQLSPDLPNKIEYDPHTISQVLNNFISNAIKFNKENGQITVQALLHKKQNSLIKEAGEASINWFINKDIQVDQDSLFVAVTNTGLGISDDQIGKLFNKFFQVKTEFAQKGGTGLGLAIAKSIIESHGGMVGVQSTKGQGATFYFTIPIN
jgi:signal transduction histidine kinase